MKASTPAEIERDAATYGVLGQASVGPGEQVTLLLGLYENCIIPDIKIAITSERDDAVSASLRHEDNNGDYWLTCRLQNQSNNSCVVRVSAPDETGVSLR